MNGERGEGKGVEERERRRERGEREEREGEAGREVYPHIPAHPLIYLQIPSYTPKYSILIT